MQMARSEWLKGDPKVGYLKIFDHSVHDHDHENRFGERGPLARIFLEYPKQL